MSGDRVSSDFLPPSTWAPEPHDEAQRQEEQQWHQQQRQQAQWHQPQWQQPQWQQPQWQPPQPQNVVNLHPLRQSVGSMRRKPVPSRENALVLRDDIRRQSTMSPISPPPPPLREVTEKVDTVSELEKKFRRISTHSTSLFRPPPPPPPAAPLRHHSDETHERRAEVRPRGVSTLRASPISMPQLSGPSSADVLDKMRRSVYMDPSSLELPADPSPTQSPPPPVRSPPARSPPARSPPARVPSVMSRRPVSMAWNGSSSARYRVSSVPPATVLPSERPVRPIGSAHELKVVERRLSMTRPERRQSALAQAQAQAPLVQGSPPASPPRRQMRAPSLDSMSEEIWQDPDGIFGASAKSLSVAKMNESIDSKVGSSPNSKERSSRNHDHSLRVQRKTQPAELSAIPFFLPGEEPINPGEFCSTAFEMHAPGNTSDWERGFSFKPGGSEIECVSCKLRIPSKSFRIEENSYRWEVSTRFIAKSHKAKEGAAGMATFGCVLCPQSPATYRSRNELWAHLESHSRRDFEQDSDLTAFQLSPVSRRPDALVSQW